MDLQEACKKSIQSYFDGQDVLPQGRKYTKQYLDNFHNNVKNPSAKVNKPPKATPNSAAQDLLDKTSGPLGGM